MKSKRCGLAFLALAGLPAAAGAQTPDWRVSVGGAVLVAPDYPGAKTYGARVAPYLDATYHDAYFASLINGVGVNLVNGRLRAGPLVKFDFGRRESASPALRGMGNIAFAAEPGLFASYDLGHFEMRAELRQGILGHHGLIGEAGLRYYWSRDGYLLSVGPALTWTSGKYNRAFFGVDAAQSARSGHAPYAPGGGVSSAGLETAAGLPVLGPLGAAVFARYTRYLGDAARSPLVNGAGSRNTFLAGLALSWQFEW